MRRVVDFMRRLSENNCREWFDDHRNEWQQVRGIYNEFAEELIAGISTFDSSIRGLRASDCTYRIARDTRFSTDKTPYKSWLGIYIAPHGKKSGYAGYYFHIATPYDTLLNGHMLAAGLYCPEGVVLRSVRDEIFDNGAEFTQAIEKAQGFELMRESMLKRTPQGFPTGTEYDDLLRLKEFDVSKPIDEAFLFADNLVERSVEEFRKTHAFVEILNRAVQYAYEEMM